MSGLSEAVGGGPPPIEAPTPNVDARRGAAPDLIVLHYTNMASPAAALDRLRDPAAEVSAHYLIGADGTVWRLAAEEERAWHAGVSSWRGAGDVNARSIGVELDHPGHDRLGRCPPFAEAQMARLEALLASVTARWGLPPEAVVGHSDVAPRRKIDPGEAFDWRRLARRGLALDWPTPSARPVPGAAPNALEPLFRRATAQLGYGDWPTDALVDAARRRFRPEALGPAPHPRALEPEDLAALPAGP